MPVKALGNVLVLCAIAVVIFAAFVLVVCIRALDEAAAHARDEGLRDQARKAAERIRAGLPPDKELTHLRDEMRRLREGSISQQYPKPLSQESAPED